MVLNVLIKMKTRIYAAPAGKGLILTALKYFRINHGNQKVVFQFEIIINVRITKTFMMTSKNNNFGLHGLCKNISAF